MANENDGRFEFYYLNIEPIEKQIYLVLYEGNFLFFFPLLFIRKYYFFY